MVEDKWIGKGIHMRCTLEMIGAPKEHVEATLKNYVKSLKTRENLTVAKSNYAEPEPKDKLFSVFTELNIWFKDMPELFGFCIEAMPSSIEILEPIELKLSDQDMTDLVNDLQSRLHALDMKIKQVTAQNKLLENNTIILATNLVATAIANGSDNLDSLLKATGIPKEKLEPFLEELVNEKRIKKEGDKFLLNK